MHKKLFDNICEIVKIYVKRLNDYFLIVYRKVGDFSRQKITSWWQIIVLSLFGVIFLYYPIGGLIIHNIDTSSTYKPKISDGRMGAIDVISYLINREVHYKLWTPNLPFLFPSYFLDNMPSFQQGIMSAVAQSSKAIEAMSFVGNNKEAKVDIIEGVELLQYPGNVWLVSPQNSLLPAPSSNTQYKKGRKKLNNFNRALARGKIDIDRSSQNLVLALMIVKKDINKAVLNTEKYVREKSGNFVDFGADEEFYFNKGKFYAYSQILKALGGDFKNVLIKYDVYQQWTSILKLLEQAAEMNPLIVRNGEVGSIMVPNHLLMLNYFASMAVNRINVVIGKLDKKTDKENDY